MPALVLSKITPARRAGCWRFSNDVLEDRSRGGADVPDVAIRGRQQQELSVVAEAQASLLERQYA